MNRLDIAQGWSTGRLSALRGVMAGHRFDAIAIPRWDRHQSEYCAPCDERLAWASGFSGTWGVGFIGLSAAALFVDGRYTVQAAAEVSKDFDRLHLYDDRYEDWLGAIMPKGGRLGFDPLIVNPDMHDRLSAASFQHGFSLQPFAESPVDQVWTDRPIPPLAAAMPFPETSSGESTVSKLNRLCGQMEDDSVDLLVESQLDNIAWLLNLRGRDVPDNPFLQSFLIVGRDGQHDFFCDERKLGNDRRDFELDSVRLHPMDAFGTVLEQRTTALKAAGTVVSDPRFSPVAIKLAAARSQAAYKPQTSPITRLKSIKNPIELAGMRAASLRDSLAWVRLLHWLDCTVNHRHEAGRPISEMEVEQELSRLRAQFSEYVSPSFQTIAASGANGAMCHYNPPAEGGAILSPDRLFLLDAGAQFLDGTTDTTRTMCFGKPDPEWRKCYTLVLKGHIRLCTVRFPPMTKGYQLDSFAREALWEHGLDYDHGTGHGVGHFLSVHEHPQRIGKEPLVEALHAGMTITNEPGYYRAGAFGIRIENLCEIVADPDGFLRLVPMAYIPLAKDLIDPALLTDREIGWVNLYHAEALARLSAHLAEDPAKDWLQNSTRPLVAR